MHSIAITLVLIAASQVAVAAPLLSFASDPNPNFHQRGEAINQRKRDISRDPTKRDGADPDDGPAPPFSQYDFAALPNQSRRDISRDPTKRDGADPDDGPAPPSSQYDFAALPNQSRRDISRNPTKRDGANPDDGPAPPFSQYDFDPDDGPAPPSSQYDFAALPVDPSFCT